MAISHLGYLENNGELLRRTALLFAMVQPDLEGSQLLSKERTVLEGFLLFKDPMQLRQAEVQGKIPSLPEMTGKCGSEGIVQVVCGRMNEGTDHMGCW